jgi:hypothetical protein
VQPGTGEDDLGGVEDLRTTRGALGRAALGSPLVLLSHACHRASQT